MPGPFPARKLTSNLWSCVKRAKKKVDRMYFEVRYAKGCPGLSDNKAMFRLKEDGKKLSDILIGWPVKISLFIKFSNLWSVFHLFQSKSLPYLY